jgi:acyl-CoA reductase-like NAD-dependent aldehyde dehydrogenase
MEKHYDSFVEEMGKYMKSMKIWDPMLAETQIPPMARTDLVDEIHEQVQRSVMQWARLVCGWNKAWSRGEYYEGTVLADVTPEIASYHEEVFGPVASIIKSKNLQDSIRIANDSDFGLSAVVYWDDIEQCREVAGQLEWWMIFVNAGAWSKPHLPFGWVRKSWYGKENGPEGLRAFMNKKVIVY